VEYSLTPLKGDKQFKRALELRCRHTARLERAASGDWVVKLKDLRTRAEVTVARADAIRQLATA
jgi:histidyl-tRNA synthetase